MATNFQPQFKNIINLNFIQKSKKKKTKTIKND